MKSILLLMIWTISGAFIGPYHAERWPYTLGHLACFKGVHFLGLEMVQHLRALVALLEDLCFIPSKHMVVHNLL